MDSATKSGKTTKRHCFIEEDDHGLASIVDTKQQQQKTSFSGNNHYPPLVSTRPLYNYNSSSIMPRRTSSFRNVSSGYVSSPRSGNNLRFYCEEPHFLGSCFRCKKPLGNNRDIFMYRGDTPFCSEECRQEQIEIDEAQEKSLNLSASMRALRKKEQRKSTASNNTPQDCPIRSSTVAAA